MHASPLTGHQKNQKSEFDRLIEAARRNKHTATGSKYFHMKSTAVTTSPSADQQEPVPQQDTDRLHNEDLIILDP